MQKMKIFLLVSLFQAFYGLKPLKVRYLESNSWLLDYGSSKIAIDPVLEGPLDFGIPILYSGKRRFLDGDKELQNIVDTVNYVLISQGFDDHAHTPTLRKLRELKPSMNYVCPPSAIGILKNCGIKEYNIKLISPGESLTIADKGIPFQIRATTGALLGPPWQAKENGYIITTKDYPSLYYEPHCMFDPQELSQLNADVVITPIVAQKLPAYTLVDGDAKAIELCKLLKARAVIPMANGELDQSGILSKLLITEGSKGESTFTDLLASSRIKTNFIPAPPGKEVSVTAATLAKI